jgi:hypothetical protein
MSATTTNNAYATLQIAKRLREEGATPELLDALEESADHDGMELANFRAEQVDNQKRELLQRTCEVLMRSRSFSTMPLADRQLLELVLEQCPELEPA